MNTTTLPRTKSPHLLFWIAGIAVILFSVAGIAAIMGWIPTSMGHPADNTEIVPPAKVAAIETKPAAPRKTAVRPPAQTEHRPAPEHVANNAPVRASCADCGVVESVREVTVKGQSSAIGVAGGAVVGGLLGHQIGSGNGNTAATVLGAVGGAVAGNEVEKRVKSRKAYEVTVRLNDGSSRVITESNPPGFHNGDRVRVVGGALQADS